MINYEHSAVAIIPARGGSKGLPGKNTKLLAGKPLIAYSIEAAKKSRFVSRVIVTTDDPKIAEVAKAAGAEVPFLRPAEIAQDSTPMLPVVRHTLEWLQQNENFAPEFVLMIQPTSPFVKTEQIDALFELLVSKGADSGITTIELPRPFHPYHVRHLTESGYLEFDQPELHYQHPTRQSDPKRYAFASVYWFNRDLFLKENKIEPGKRVGLPVDPATAHDINNAFDWEIAEVLVKKYG
ncbi:MAG: acylneuraminate cytidylyltransferase family protein [bacterium]|nr:acylneuraminate cytidylyltransferase family protein [bacterium]